MSVEVKKSDPQARRTSVYVDGYAHSNPIPAACRIDNLICSSLIHGIDRERNGTVPTLERQAELMFARLREIVEAAGGSTGDVVKVTMWMRDRSDRDAVNRFWIEMFPDADDRPARQTFNAQLDGDQLIQCEFIAVVNKEEGETRS